MYIKLFGYFLASAALFASLAMAIMGGRWQALEKAAYGKNRHRSDPAIVLAALKVHELNPAETLLVGDRVLDIRRASGGNPHLFVRCNQSDHPCGYLQLTLQAVTGNIVNQTNFRPDK